MAEVRIAWDDAAIRMDTESEHNAIGRGMRRLADRAVLEMKRRCPVSPVGSGRSGTLRSSIRAIRQADGSYLIGPTATVGPPWQPPQYLGPLVERGTGPHPIDSHGPWPLRNRRTGQVFGRHVNHPGTRPQPFIDPTATAMSGTVEHI